MKAILRLRCDGYQEKGFHFCVGVVNEIVDLEKIESTQNYHELLQYLNSVTKVFDDPCCNYNIVTNALYKIFTLGYLTELQHSNLAYFYNMHRKCGLILDIIPKK